jgi:hypothetical protein
MQTSDTASLINSSLSNMSEKEKEKPINYNTANFEPFTREEFAKATYGANKYWFAKHYSKKWGQSFASRFLDQAARCLSLKPEDKGKQEGDQLLDAMRNDPDFYTEKMLMKACGGSESERIGRARTSSSTSSLKENVAPIASSRITSRFSDYDDDSRDSDDIFRSDGVIVETPTEARGIEDDGDDESDMPTARTTHENGKYSTPSSSRLSTVYEESSGGKAGTKSRDRPIYVDPDSDDDDNDYDDEDDYHDMMGHEFGKESFYDDYRGEFDGSYNDY